MKDEVQKDFKFVKTNSAWVFLKAPPRGVLFLIKSKVDRLLPAFLFTCLCDQLKSNDKNSNRVADQPNSFTFIFLSTIHC